MQERLANRAFTTLRSFGQRSNLQITATPLRESVTHKHRQLGLKSIPGLAIASLHTSAKSWQPLTQQARVMQQTGSSLPKQLLPWQQRAAAVRSMCSQSSQKASISRDGASSKANVLAQRSSSAARSMQNTMKGAGSAAYKVLPNQVRCHTIVMIHS